MLIYDEGHARWILDQYVSHCRRGDREQGRRAVSSHRLQVDRPAWAADHPTTVTQDGPGGSFADTWALCGTSALVGAGVGQQWTPARRRG
jgi:hypothetical protein